MAWRTHFSLLRFPWLSPFLLCDINSIQYDLRILSSSTSLFIAPHPLPSFPFPTPFSLLLLFSSTPLLSSSLLCLQLHLYLSLFFSLSVTTQLFLQACILSLICRWTHPYGSSSLSVLVPGDPCLSSALLLGLHSWGSRKWTSCGTNVSAENFYDHLWIISSSFNFWWPDMNAWLNSMLIYCLTDSLTHWLIDWLTDWLADWLIDWLTDWLIDWLTDQTN